MISKSCLLFKSNEHYLLCDCIYIYCTIVFYGVMNISNIKRNLHMAMRHTTFDGL